MVSTGVFTKTRTHTLDEILSQPHCWGQCLSQVASSQALAAVSRLIRAGAEWTFIGCGSSYYVAKAAASTFSHLGLLARALPASEVLLYPDFVIPKNRACIPVMISRSGLTSELLAATRMLEKKRNFRTMTITCGRGQALETIASVVLKLPEADETSTVMTRSFTSMLLVLQYLGATISGATDFAHALMRLPEQVLPLLADTPARLREFVQSHEAADYIFLAHGPLFGIASEAMLKMMECSCSYSQVFHSLEFRHGPKSIVGPETLITVFASEASYDSELQLLREMKDIGATTFLVANAVDPRARQAADFFIELGLQTPEYSRLAAYAIWGQLFGVYTGLKKGLNPDSPRNLARVVVLDGQS